MRHLARLLTGSLPLFALTSLVAAGAATAQPAPAAQASPEARARGMELIKQAAAAMGGADKLAAVKDVTVKGKVVLNGPMGEVSGESVAYVLYPNKIKSVITLPMGEMVQGYDGKTAWVQMGGQSQELPAAMNQEMERSITTSGAIGIMRLALDGQAEVEAVGEADVNGKNADEVLWKRGAQEIRLFLDAKTHLLAKEAFRGTTPQGEMDIEVITSDHRDVGGVKVPFKVIGLQAGQPYLQLTVSDVQLNAGLDPGMFAKP
jgi:hypothetical protein